MLHGHRVSAFSRRRGAVENPNSMYLTPAALRGRQHGEKKVAERTRLMETNFCSVQKGDESFDLIASIDGLELVCHKTRLPSLWECRGDQSLVGYCSKQCYVVTEYVSELSSALERQTDF